MKDLMIFLGFNVKLTNSQWKENVLIQPTKTLQIMQLIRFGNQCCFQDKFFLLDGILSVPLVTSKY